MSCQASKLTWLGGVNETHKSGMTSLLIDYWELTYTQFPPKYTRYGIRPSASIEQVALVSVHVYFLLNLDDAAVRQVEHLRNFRGDVGTAGHRRWSGWKLLQGLVGLGLRHTLAGSRIPVNSPPKGIIHHERKIRVRIILWTCSTPIAT